MKSLLKFSLLTLFVFIYSCNTESVISDDELIIIKGTKVKFNPGLLLIIEFRNKAVALLLCEERTTSCATRSNDPFTMLSVSSSVCSSLNLFSAVVEPSRLPCPSSLRTTLIGL